jgi:hypothetical protein
MLGKAVARKLKKSNAAIFGVALLFPFFRG